MGQEKIVSTGVDVATFDRLDAFCTRIHRNRAEVMRGLLYALLIDEKQFIFDEWRVLVGPHNASVAVPMAPPRITAEDAIRRVMGRGRPMTVRELKRTTSSKHIRPVEWDKAFQRLIEARELRLMYERTTSGKTRKMVTLLRSADGTD